MRPQAGCAGEGVAEEGREVAAPAALPRVEGEERPEEHCALQSEQHVHARFLPVIDLERVQRSEQGGEQRAGVQAAATRQVEADAVDD